MEEKILIHYCDACGGPKIPENFIWLKENMESEDFVKLLFSYRNKIDDLVQFEKVVGHPDFPELFHKKLTARETQVLAEVAMHGAVKSAAECVGISYQTVKNHLSAVYKKLGVGTVTMALSQTGWLNVPQEFLNLHPKNEDDLWSAKS